MDKKEYEFPDEKAEKDAASQQNQAETELEEGDVEVDIIDDTPEADRGRKPLAKQPDEPTDEELTQYTAGVQQRIKELTHARHDERRAKEEAVREKQELERAARALAAENKRLQQYVHTGETAYATTLKSAASSEMEMAKKKLKEAHEAFDTDAIVEAQADLNSAQMKLMQAENFKPTPLQEDDSEVEIAANARNAPRPDEKTLNWQAKNQWFGKNDEMTAVAFVAHKKLIDSGVDPRSDKYFESIDSRVRQLFPEAFSSEKDDADDEPPVVVRKAATVVAPAKRSSGAKKVTLTKTQVAIAKRLGVPLDLYAKQVAAQEAQNG
jgi:hypothetical protein